MNRNCYIAIAMIVNMPVSKSSLIIYTGGKFMVQINDKLREKPAVTQKGLQDNLKAAGITVTQTIISNDLHLVPKPL